MRRLLSRTLLALGCGLTAVATVIVTAGPAAAAVPPYFGIAFVPDGDPGQCSGPGQQWVPSPDWSIPIRLDTDSRSGGCQLAFGISDPTDTLAGLAISYQWSVSPGGDSGQCGNQGTFSIPITPFRSAFGENVRVDADNRSGWCNLTFQVSGRSDVALDVQFYSDGDEGQCKGALPQGQWLTAGLGSPVTLGLDMDRRSGGCNLALRLRRG
jgi:hypothetical protein